MNDIEQLNERLKKKENKLKEKENKKMYLIYKFHDEEIAQLKSQIEKRKSEIKEVQQDIETLKYIHSAIDKSPLYKKHYLFYYAYDMDRGISVRNIDFVSSCNENNETTKCKDAIFNAWKVYIEQADLPKAAYINTLPRSWCEIYQSYDLTSIIRSAIAERVQELEAEPQAKEQGNEPSTFNDEMKGLYPAQEVPNSKGNLAK